MRRLLVVALVLLPAASAVASTEVTAHRGGSLVEGRPVRPENSLSALEHAARRGWVLEFDIGLTRDGVPVIIHDDTLDRTTNCTGLVKDRTAADLRANCRIDTLGTGTAPPTLVDAPEARREPVPTLAEVLDMALERGATISPEIKNVPPTTQRELTGPDDFDANPLGFATTVSRALAAHPFPPARMIVQSFWPPNLEVARQHLPAAQLSLLTIRALNDGNPEFAAASRFDWSSPEWAGGLDPTLVARAHAYGLGVTVFTLDAEDDIRKAAAAGVDAVITNDPSRAERMLRRPTESASR